MANRVDLRKLMKLKLQGVSNSKALLESGASQAVAYDAGRHNAKIKEILENANEYFREGILRGALKVASIETIGQRLMSTAVQSADNFNSTNAIKVLGQIIMTRSGNVSNINVVGNVFVIPPQLAPEQWQSKYGNSKPATYEEASKQTEA